jgi:hypothetical protein
MILLGLFACAADLRDVDGDGVLDVATGEVAAEDEAAPVEVLPLVVSTEADGSYRVDADSHAVTHVDFGSLDRAPEQVDAAGGWEMSLERYFYRLNPGDGGAPVEAVWLGPVPWAEVVAAPEAGWVADIDEALALGDWYVYDSENHVLYAADGVYAVRNAAGEAWKLQFIDYYDDFGNTGFPSFRVAPLPAAPSE